MTRPSVLLLVLSVACSSPRQPPVEPPPAPESPPWEQLSAMPPQVTAAEFRAALERLDPFRQLSSSLRIAGDGVAVFDGGNERVAWAPLAKEPRPQNPEGGADDSLAGRRILLDPGHYGGTYSELESRHLELEEGGTALREGNINYGVAVVLERMLRAEGAEVLLSRGPPPVDPFDGDTAIELFGLTPDEPEDEMSVFQSFNQFDLARRGLLAEQWGADITVSLHFNMAARDEVNGVIVFSPGHILEGELEDPFDRFYAIRRALEGDLEFMDRFAESVSRNLQREMDMVVLEQMPWLPAQDPRKKHPINEEQGVWKRNLAMLKRAKGPVVLVEGPCMNNPEEFLRLTTHDFEVYGRGYPLRVKQYARAVYQALRDHAARLGPSAPP